MGLVWGTSWAKYLQEQVEFVRTNFIQLRVLKLEEACAIVLRRHREQKKLSQHDLAYEANINRNNVSLYETGNRLPNLATLFAICRALDVPPEEFVREIARMNPTL